MQPAGESLVGWVQPTILHKVTSGGLHPPYVLKKTESVTFQSPRLNQATAGLVQTHETLLDIARA